jgi:hypothetical protein
VRPARASDLYATLEGRADQIDTVYALLADTAEVLEELGLAPADVNPAGPI